MKYLKPLLFTIISLLTITIQAKDVVIGAAQTEKYIPLLKDQKIALFSNHTGMVQKEHTLDILVKNQINVTAIFSPEHGFRGKADAGEKVNNSIDRKTGIPILSLYSHKSLYPSEKDMDKFTTLVIDIQDVGLRFYTYYISIYRLMNACALHHKKIVLLDRPNPNGYYVDGPILQKKYYSGVGILPIPVVHGMTLGELTTMINEKRWLKNAKQCNLTIIKCKNYTHQTKYQLEIAPSPNLPNMRSIYLYSSMCYFEGTNFSLGRGTTYPFQVYGHPKMRNAEFTFTPRSIKGAKYPPLLNVKCKGKDLRKIPIDTIIKNQINLEYIIDAYKNTTDKRHFFKPFFEKLIGVGYVREMIKKGKNAEEIRVRWQKDVIEFKKLRKPYLLYKE